MDLSVPSGALDEPVSRFFCGQSFGSSKCHMSHLSTRTRHSLTVQMEHSSCYCMECVGPFAGCHESYFFTNEIHHDRRTQESYFSQWEATGHSYLLFELGYRTDVQCIMTRVVRARRNLVNQEGTIFGVKEFHAENADTL